MVGVILRNLVVGFDTKQEEVYRKRPIGNMFNVFILYFLCGVFKIIYLSKTHKPFAFEEILTFLKEHFMSTDEFCEHASNDEFIKANFDSIVVLAHDVATATTTRC